MRLKFIYNILLLAGSGLFFASCDSGYDVGVDTGLVAVEFRAGNISHTRTTNGGNEWIAGDQAGVFMLAEGGSFDTPDDVLENNRRYSTDASGETSAFTLAEGSPLYYPQNGGKVDFIAYYPYKSPLTGYTYPVDIRNQSTPAAIDVLYSNNATSKNKNSGAVELQFKHVLSKLSFTLTSGDGAPDLTSATVQVTNIATTATIDLGDGSATATNSGQTVTANTATDGWSSSTIVIPQENVTGARLIITLKAGAGKFEWNFPSPTTFQPGKEYSYLITVSKTGITVSSSGIAIWAGTGDAPTTGTAQRAYKVGDYYPDPANSNTAIGVVFQITDQGGAHGKIVSLDEKTEFSWGKSKRDEKSAGVAGIRDENDGAAATRNIITQYELSYDLQKYYQGFHWIFWTKNSRKADGEWYLPAKNELKEFITQWKSDKPGWNTKFIDAGGSAMDATYYWSSTEYDHTFAYFVNIAGATGYSTYNKETKVAETQYGNYPFGVRAIKKF
ncbi:MAG TPA: hypothetical protein DDZ78_05430 [Porphyromonadaceae bacterium]|nr:hypothetical protein [Porphyromonadaceae bacterium]